VLQFSNKINSFYTSDICPQFSNLPVADASTNRNIMPRLSHPGAACDRGRYSCYIARCRSDGAPITERCLDRRPHGRASSAEAAAPAAKAGPCHHPRVRTRLIARGKKTVRFRKEPLGMLMNRYGRFRRNVSHRCILRGRGIPGVVEEFGAPSTNRCQV